MDWKMLVPGALGAGATAVKGFIQDGGKTKAILGFALGFAIAVYFVDPLLHIFQLDKTIYYGVTMFALGYGGASVLDAFVEAAQKWTSKKIGGGE